MYKKSKQQVQTPVPVIGKENIPLPQRIWKKYKRLFQKLN